MPLDIKLYPCQALLHPVFYFTEKNYLQASNFWPLSFFQWAVHKSEIAQDPVITFIWSFSVKYVSAYALFSIVMTETRADIYNTVILHISNLKCGYFKRV